MRYRQDLSPAQHVARREALAQIARGSDLEASIETLVDRILEPIAEKFLGVHRLDARSYETMIADTRAHLESFGPPMMVERRKAPTRTRPKGEEHEFLLAMRSASAPDRGPPSYELTGVRILMTRRRIAFSFEANGVRVTRHALERSIERGLATWTGRLGEVEDAMLDRLGLAAVWRHAYETGKVAIPEAVLPYGDGLILCGLERLSEPRLSGFVNVSSLRVAHEETPPNPLLVLPVTQALGECVDVVLRTVVHEDLLRVAQMDLRDALVRFCDVNRAALDDITASILWRSATVDAPRTSEELAPGMEALAEGLARILAQPEHRAALSSRVPLPTPPIHMPAPWAQASDQTAASGS